MSLVDALRRSRESLEKIGDGDWTPQDSAHAALVRAIEGEMLRTASADVQLPPYARRLDVRATRAAFAAGTLGTVRDNAASEDSERDVVVRHFDGYDANVMPTDHEPREWYDEAERLRQSRLRRWQTAR